MADDFKNSPCYSAAEAAAKAAGADLSERDMAAAYRAAQRERERVRRQGNADNEDERVQSAAERAAERTRIAAAMQRRHAALNILVRDRLDQALEAFKAAGLSPRNALLAVIEGSQQGIKGARASVYAKRLAYEARYVGGMMAEIQRDRPHLVHMLADKKLSDDVFREMGELREGGNPGVTGDEDAKFLAGVFAKYAEMSRTELNRLGASVGKLDGWAGAQVHDDIKMIAAGKDQWIDAVLPMLDVERTFPDAGSVAEVRDILGDVYDTLVTGVPNKATAREKGQRVNPANLAKSLGKTRVLHFKDAEAAIAYRDQFGWGNSIYGVMHHQRRAAQMAAAMESFGPNPEVMFNSIVEAERRKIRDSGTIPDAEKQKQLGKLNADTGALRAALDVMTGSVARPGSVRMASISNDIRALQAYAKLGGALLTAMPTDVSSTASAAMFRGGGFWKGMVQQLDGIFHGRPKGEQAEIAFLLGEGFDGMIGDIVSRGLTNDAPIGKISRLADLYYRWNGLTWWTDVNRAVASRTIAAEMGMRAKTAHADLPANYRHVLSLHGIGEAEWNALSQAKQRAVNGNDYITPDAIRGLPDEAIASLASDRLKTAKTDERRAEILDDARRDLEMAILRFVADETNFAVIETDAASRRIATWNGTRPGTIAGEAVRFIMQFKGFPIAFAQRVIGRTLFGSRGATKYERMIQGLPNLGALIAGMTVAGYMSMVMKDAAKGYWPPRDPTDPRVIVAALQQGGALGIYGDYLFGQANRYGSGMFETLSGPAIGTASDLLNLGPSAIQALNEGKKPRTAGDVVNIAINNAPGINMFYTRAALDVLFLNALRNWISPGYIQRQRRNRYRDYKQTSPLPMTLNEAMR